MDTPLLGHPESESWDFRKSRAGFFRKSIFSHFTNFFTTRVLTFTLVIKGHEGHEVDPAETPQDEIPGVQHSGPLVIAILGHFHGTKHADDVNLCPIQVVH